MSSRAKSVTDLRKRAAQRDEIELTRSRVIIVVLVLVGLLLVVGLGAVMSASSVDGILQGSDRFSTFGHQLRWVVVGVILMGITIRIPYQWYMQFSVWILGVAAAALLLVPIFGTTRGGARRWLEVGSVTIQPSEVAKLAVVIFLATAYSKRSERLGEVKQFGGPLLVIGFICALVVLQPDLGTALIIAGAAGGVVLASGVPMRYILGAGALGVALAALATYAEEYRLERFKCFFDELADPQGACFQVAQSRMALGSGSMTGVGLGASRARWAFLPNADTDFIFTIIAEESGFVGAILLLAVLAGLSLAGIWIAYRTDDLFARLLATGITTWLAAQSIVNVGGVVGAIPVTGLALPFMSVGGTAMVAALVGAGVLINIARTAPMSAPSKRPAGRR